MYVRSKARDGLVGDQTIWAHSQPLNPVPTLSAGALQLDAIHELLRPTIASELTAWESLTIERSDAMMKNLQPALEEECLYLGDNGRMFCGSERCAGASAYHTAHDISDQPVLKITDGHAREMLDRYGCRVECESCHREHRFSAPTKGAKR